MMTIRKVRTIEFHWALVACRCVDMGSDSN